MQKNMQLIAFFSQVEHQLSPTYTVPLHLSIIKYEYGQERTFYNGS